MAFIRILTSSGGASLLVEQHAAAGKDETAREGLRSLPWPQIV
jgi:hypothetical protein